jgi:hypothetical protein
LARFPNLKALRLLFPALLLAAAAAPALAAPVSSHVSYIVSLGGINIAAVDVELEDDGSRYQMDVAANVTGLGQMVASGTARVNSSGRISGGRLVSEKFDLATRANGEDFSVRIGYAGGNVASFIVDPPILDNNGRVPIERKHLTGVNDFLASFVFKGGALDKSLCARKMHIFTGVERFDIAMHYAGDDVATSQRTGYQGPVVLCSVKYTPVSGHFTTSEITNYLTQSDHILVWYAPLGETGYFVPYRVLMTTSVGDLSMVLTGMN